MAIEEMEKVLMKLAHSNSAVPALKKTLLLDSRALLDYFAHLRQPRPSLPNDSFFVEVSGSLQALRNILDRSVAFELPPPLSPNYPTQSNYPPSSPYQ
jgi:glutathione S-transferase